MPSITNIILLGITGVGKSALSKLMADLTSSGDHPFQDSSGINSQTKTCCSFTNSQGDRIIDAPGLFDSDGHDTANIRDIVNFIKESSLSHISCYLLVIDGSDNRLDESIQSTFEILVATFGPSFVSNLGIFYSKVTNQESRERCEAKTNKIAEVLSARTGIEVSRPIPYWCGDTFPKATAANVEREFNVKIPERDIERKVNETITTVNQILTFARELPPASTVDIAYGEYSHTKQLREEREAAEKQRIYDASIVSTIIQSKVDTKATESWVKKKKKAGFNAGKIILPIRHDDAYMIEHTKVESQRTVTKYGNGVESYGDWKVVRGGFKVRER